MGHRVERTHTERIHVTDIEISVVFFLDEAPEVFLLRSSGEKVKYINKS